MHEAPESPAVLDTASGAAPRADAAGRRHEAVSRMADQLEEKGNHVEASAAANVIVHKHRQAQEIFGEVRNAVLAVLSGTQRRSCWNRRSHVRRPCSACLVLTSQPTDSAAAAGGAAGVPAADANMRDGSQTPEGINEVSGLRLREVAVWARSAWRAPSKSHFFCHPSCCAMDNLSVAGLHQALAVRLFCRPLLPTSSVRLPRTRRTTRSLATRVPRPSLRTPKPPATRA